MKKLLTVILFGIILGLGSSALADNKSEALAFFNNYIKAANTYSPTLTTMYAPNAKITRQVIKPNGELVNVNTDTATYIHQMKISQGVAKMNKYTNEYSNIVATPIGNNWKISAIRTPMQDSDKLKMYQIIKKQPNGKWIIIEELMQTRQQIFLKYAK